MVKAVTLHTDTVFASTDPLVEFAKFVFSSTQVSFIPNNLSRFRVAGLRDDDADVLDVFVRNAIYVLTVAVGSSE